MRSIWTTSAIAIAVVMTPGAPVNAADTTAVTLGSVDRSGSSVTLGGTIVLGDDSLAPVELGTDAAADELGGAAPLPLGTDLVKASVSMDAEKRLVFKIEVSDPPSATESIAPAFSYLWPIAVNAEDLGSYLKASNDPSGSGKTYHLCKRDVAANSLSCPRVLTGSMSNGVTTLTVRTSHLGAPGGSTIDPGALGGGTSCNAICATLTPGPQTLYNAGGDDLALSSSYIVPGGVEAAVAPVSTPDSSIVFKTTGTVGPTGTWSAVVSAPNLVAGTQYKAAARSCFGLQESPTCIVTTQLFTA
jgi:hypothetical protein